MAMSDVGLAPPEAKIERLCMRDRVRDTIVTRILNGTYPAGTRLKELVLARELGTSQAPVREALRELEVLGLVESERYKGSRVKATEAAELGEAYELRALIEARAAELAVPCSPASLAILRSATEAMRRAAARGDVDAYASASIAFHRSLVEMSRNQLFLRTWDGLRWEVRTRIATQRALVDLPRLAAEHDAIVAALARGAGTEAGRLVRDLLERLAERNRATETARGEVSSVGA